MRVPGIAVPAGEHATLPRNMIRGARYVHTNLIAKDWQALARFYEQVFGCEPVPPIRDFAAHEVEAGTANGPIEIFTYSQQLAPAPAAPNRPGFAHIAFAISRPLSNRADHRGA
jgi:hypothetical protein